MFDTQNTKVTHRYDFEYLLWVILCFNINKVILYNCIFIYFKLKFDLVTHRILIML